MKLGLNSNPGANESVQELKKNEFKRIFCIAWEDKIGITTVFKHIFRFLLALFRRICLS